MTDPRTEPVKAATGLFGRLATRLVLKLVLYPAILLGFAGLAFLAAKVLGFVSSYDNKLTLRNSLDSAVTVQIDEEPPLTIAAGDQRMVRPKDGDHRIRASKGRDSVVDAKFTIPKSTRSDKGFIGVYDVGGRSAFLIVHQDGSGKDAPDRSTVKRWKPQVQPFELPAEVTSQTLDAVFRVHQPPNTQSLFGPDTVRLCTFDPVKLRVGCNLCESDYARCGSDNHGDEKPFVLEKAPP